MDNQKKVLIDSNTKGVMVFARHDEPQQQLGGRPLIRHEWLIIIHSAENELTTSSFRVYSHLSYCLTTGSEFVNEITPGWWGSSKGYTFYEPTEEQKQMMIRVLKNNNLKFISPLNKLIRVK